MTRAGERELLAGEVQIPPEYRTTYQACVYTTWADAPLEVYRMPLRERVPAIRIPLRESDPFVALDIQALIDQAYEDGDYSSIDYVRPCDPPLEGEDAVWADELLKAAGGR